MAGDPTLAGMAGEGGSLGRGGMITKVSAAKLAARSGACTIIASGRENNVLVRLAQGEEIGTMLLPEKQPMAARKQWLAGQLKARGQLIIDAGAVKVLTQSGKSLLPVGVIGCKGQFDRGDVVTCIDEAGREVARGLVNYDSREAERLLRASSDRIEELLGYSGEVEIIHRDNMVLVE